MKVLVVCLGNICRSPAAEGVLRDFALKNYQDLGITVQSCGIGSWHVGQLPDERMRAVAKRRGFTLSSRAQQFKKEFLDHFDYILAVDAEVLNELYKQAHTPEHKAKIHLVTAFSPCFQGEEIPDPYYQGEAGFERVMDMLEDACNGFLQHLSKTAT